MNTTLTSVFKQVCIVTAVFPTSLCLLAPAAADPVTGSHTSNTKQLALGQILYAQDYDPSIPYQPFSEAMTVAGNWFPGWWNSTTPYVNYAVNYVPKGTPAPAIADAQATVESVDWLAPAMTTPTIVGVQDYGNVGTYRRNNWVYAAEGTAGSKIKARKVDSEYTGAFFTPNGWQYVQPSQTAEGTAGSKLLNMVMVDGHLKIQAGERPTTAEGTAGSKMQVQSMGSIP